jgi:hypothetical protein
MTNELRSIPPAALAPVSNSELRSLTSVPNKYEALAPMASLVFGFSIRPIE